MAPAHRFEAYEAATLAAVREWRERAGQRPESASAAVALRPAGDPYRPMPGQPRDEVIVNRLAEWFTAWSEAQGVPAADVSVEADWVGNASGLCISLRLPADHSAAHAHAMRAALEDHLRAWPTEQFDRLAPRLSVIVGAAEE